MSNNTDAARSRLWVDGDAHRAPAGTILPATGLFTAATFTGWDPYGAIKAGFEVASNQDSSDLTVWNADGAYRKKKSPPIKTATLRPVDDSKAHLLTVLQGGSIAETTTGSGVFEMIPGEDEEFALLLIARDPGHGAVAYYIERGTLNDIPGEVINDDDLAGHDLVVTALTPEGGGRAVRTFRDDNPLAP